ncbi:MAG: hypothetical protein KY397_02145 [Gemmatimonadetes bacterium]|nr:hypothetical protein [Gemmatimonadota bacterium]
MRFWKLVPVFAFTLALGLGACAEGADEGEEELTPADTALTTPPPAPETAPLTGDTLADTMLMDTTHQM